MATQKEISEYLDLSDRHVRRLIKNGILPASKGAGGLDLDACRIAYIHYLRSICTHQVAEPEDCNDEVLDLERERAILAREQHRKARRENDIADGLVVPVEVITTVLSKAVEQISSVLDAIPLNIKRQVPILSARDVIFIRKEIAKCRNNATKTVIEGCADFIQLSKDKSPACRSKIY